MRRHLTLVLVLPLFCCVKAISQSSEDQSIKLVEQTQSYMQYLDMAMNNWCVFFDQNGIDPVIYDEQTAQVLTNSSYSKDLHKRLLLGAFKCEYDNKRLLYIDELINNNLVSSEERKQLLCYGVFFTHKKGLQKKKHNRYLESLEELMLEKEFASFKEKLSDDFYGEMAFFNSIVQP